MLCSLAVIPALSQPLSCDGERYYTNSSDGLIVDTVLYADVVNTQGISRQLYMDIYQPAGDNESSRALMILLHGGGFIAGSRSDGDSLCRWFANRGYVAATIDYRLWDISIGFPSLGQVYDVAIKAVGDLKAAVRFFKANASAYDIDTSLVFAGGVSAGAITALHAAYLDDSDLPLLDTLVAQAVENNGGIEGNNGDPDILGISTRLSGVLNLSGALIDTAIIQPGEPPHFAFHGTDDAVAPFGVGSGVLVLPVMGSAVIHERAQMVGIPSWLVAVEGGGHTDIYLAPQYMQERDEFFDILSTELPDLFCEDATVVVAETPALPVRLYPNPSPGHLNIENPGDQAARIILYDVWGRMCMERFVPAHSAEQVGLDLPNGMYLASVKVEGRRPEMRRVVVER